MVDFDVSDGTPGLRLHGNPLYGGRALACFTLTLAAVMVGAAYQALDEYELLLDTKLTPLPPIGPRRDDPDLPALVRLGAREGRDRRGGAAQLRRPAHGGVPARRAEGDPVSPTARTCGSAASRAR